MREILFDGSVCEFFCFIAIATFIRISEQTVVEQEQDMQQVKKQSSSSKFSVLSHLIQFIKSGDFFVVHWIGSVLYVIGMMAWQFEGNVVSYYWRVLFVERGEDFFKRRREKRTTWRTDLKPHYSFWQMVVWWWFEANEKLDRFNTPNRTRF